MSVFIGNKLNNRERLNLRNGGEFGDFVVPEGASNNNGEKLFASEIGSGRGSGGRRGDAVEKATQRFRGAHPENIPGSLSKDELERLSYLRGV